MDFLRIWSADVAPRGEDPIGALADLFGWDRFKALGHVARLKYHVARHRETGVLDGVAPRVLADWAGLASMEGDRLLRALLDAGVLCCPDQGRDAHRFCPVALGASPARGGRPRAAGLAVHGWETAMGPAVRASVDRRRSSRRLSSGPDSSRWGVRSRGGKRTPHHETAPSLISTSGPPTKTANQPDPPPLSETVRGPGRNRAYASPDSGVRREADPPPRAVFHKADPPPAASSGLESPARCGVQIPAPDSPGAVGGPSTPPPVVDSSVDVDSAVSVVSGIPVVDVHHGAGPAPAAAGCTTDRGPATAPDKFPPCPRCGPDGRIVGARRCCRCPRGRDRARRFARSYAADRVQVARGRRARGRPGERDARYLEALTGRGPGRRDQEDALGAYRENERLFVRLAAREGVPEERARVLFRRKYPAPPGHDGPPAAAAPQARIGA